MKVILKVINRLHGSRLQQVVICSALFCLLASCSSSSAKRLDTESTDGLQVITWNIANFGASKSDAEIQFVASIVKSHEVLAIQEVSTGPAGAQAVARLDDELDRTGAKWDYVVSDATTGDGSERYAVLWKTSNVTKVGTPLLCNDLASTVNREPFLVRLAEGKDTFLLAVFHAVPKSKNPNGENVQLSRVDSLYEKDHVLLMGDFNASSRTAGFNWLKRRNMSGILVNQKTSLKQKPDENGNTLANEYDNIFYELDETKCVEYGIHNFASAFATLADARKVSDHIPVWGTFKVK
jgi:hypothetical protein